jgi:hypothetical protein
MDNTGNERFSPNQVINEAGTKSCIIFKCLKYGTRHVAAMRITFLHAVYARDLAAKYRSIDEAALKEID